jgi:F420H(2)-dependent quinone reductase
VVVEPAGRPEGLGNDGGKEIAVVATQMTGAEHDRIFRKFADYAANYDAYRGRTDRELRVFEIDQAITPSSMRRAAVCAAARANGKEQGLTALTD